MLHSLFTFYRAGNMLISGVATLLGFFIGGISPLHPEPWLPVAAMMLLTAFANSHNDLVDFHVDQINRPDRPLPSGKLSWRQGLLGAWGSLVAALLIGLIDSPRHFAVFCAMGLSLWVYNKYLKGRPLVGNAWVALLTASPLAVATLDTGWKSDLWPPMLFAILLTCARELVKDIEDIPGDSACGLHTYPILRGERCARRLVLGLFAVTALALPLPVILSTYPLSFLAFCAVLVLIPLGLSVSHVLAGRWHKASGMLKLAMLGGMLSALFTLHF